MGSTYSITIDYSLPVFMNSHYFFFHITVFTVFFCIFKSIAIGLCYVDFKWFVQVNGALLVLPAAMGELFWSAAVLSALGTTLAVIIGLPLNPTIIVSGTYIYSLVFLDQNKKLLFFFQLETVTNWKSNKSNP